ncbi:MAG: carbohydrate kinase family protein [Sphingobacterium sp.]
MLNNERNGILAAGNWILDEVKLIDKFPQEQSLVNILDEYTSNGGSAYNILCALVRLGVTFPLEAIGLVGNDSHGKNILTHCQSIGINIKQLQIIDDLPTSYTVVVSVKESAKRTFFHHRGSNSKLDFEHFNFDLSNAKIFHLGYLLLLDKLDEINTYGRTNASLLLENAKQKGFITSIDLVSETSDRFTKIVPSALPYVDYLFLNEYEASQLSTIDIMHENPPIEMKKRCHEVFEKIFAMGVNEWIIIHYPAGLWAGHRSGKRIFQPSLKLKKEDIVGNNGAGDALAAGVLLGVHEGWAMDDSLNLGVCVAAASLFDVTCSGGIHDYQTCLDLGKNKGYNLSL